MIKQLENSLNELLWGCDLKQAGPLKIFLIEALRIFYATIRDLSGGLPSLRAMSLVYTTLLSIVPLLAVSFSVLKGFGAHNQLEPALLSAFEPLGEKGTQLSQQILSFVDNMKVGVLGSVGLVFLIVTVLSMMKKIESAFNFTWRIKGTRNFFQRFSNYLSVIMIGPLLLFTGAGLTASFNSSTLTNKLLAIEPFGTMLLTVGELLPYVLSIITFTLIYILIPNTRVQFRSALYGAVVTTILWKAAGSLFTTFIVNSTNYTAIYSGFAILIIFMIWIYVNWLIVLTGASIAYYHQHPERIPDQSQIIRLSCRLREKLALTIMQLVASNFHHNKPAWSLSALAEKINISEPATLLIISALQKNKLLTTCGDGQQHYLLKQAAENISVERILHAARCAEESSSLRADHIESDEKVDSIIGAIENAITTSSEDKTLKDLV